MRHFIIMKIVRMRAVFIVIAVDPSDQQRERDSAGKRESEREGERETLVFAAYLHLKRDQLW